MNLPPMVETCPTCEGRRFVLPTTHPADLGDDAPRTWWCRNCKAKGVVPSAEGQEILQFLVAAREHGWDEDATKWGVEISWPEVAS